MKRHLVHEEVEATKSEETYETAKCLLLFSHAIATSKTPSSEAATVRYECKTCHRKFLSFQALGRHRASHKRFKFDDDRHGCDGETKKEGKPRGHECSICGLEFAVGQALGGHMRRHRNALAGTKKAQQGGHHAKRAALVSFDLNSPPPDMEDSTNLMLLT